MIALVTALFGGAWSKLATYAVVAVGAIGAVLGFAFVERRAGAAGVETADLKREVADGRTAAEVSKATAREADPKAALDKEFGR